MAQPTETTVEVARRVREHRQALGWSQEVLAGNCCRAGLDWDRSAVANLENGRRAGVTIDEGLVIASVLGIPPLLLFLPLGREESIAITPLLTVEPNTARQWFDGLRPSPNHEEQHLDPDRQRLWASAIRPPVLYRQRDDRWDKVLRCRQLVKDAHLSDDARKVKSSRAAYSAALRDHAATLEQMLREGVHPPRIPIDVVTDMNIFGVEVPSGLLTAPAGEDDSG